MPNLEIAQISDEEAQNLLGQYDEASPERQGYIGTALRQYQGQRAEIDSVDADAHFEKLFTDDDYFKQTSDQSQIQTAASVSPFPNAVKYRGANQAYLAHQLGVNSESLNGAAYEAQRDGYAKAYLAKDGGITDEAFFSGVKSQQQKKIDTRNAINEIPADIVAARFDDLDTGATRSTTELLQAWKDKHADIVPSDGDESVALRSAAQFFAENDEWMSRNAAQAKAIFQTLKSFSAGEGKSDTEPVEGENPLRDLGAQLSEMSPEDRMRLYGMAALYARRTGDPKGYFQQLGESVSRTVGEFGQSARSANREALLSSRLQELETGRANTLTGAPVAASEEERSNEAERIRQQLGAIQVSRELFQVARGEIDPITPLTEGWVGRLEEGSYNAAGSVPYLAAAAIPFAGTPLAIAAYSTQEYDRIRLEYPDISIGEAQGMALVSGSVQGALDKLQAEAVLGRLPMTGALLRNFAKPTTPFLARLAAGSGLNFTEQFGQETLQNITPLVVDEAARALGADMPDRDWNKELENFKEGQVQTFFALLPFWLVGTGAIGIREVHRGEQFVSNVSLLEKSGIDTNTAEAIANEPDLDKQESKLQAAWQNITPEEKQRLISETDTANATTQTLQESPIAPTVEQARGDDGSMEWIVRAPHGREMYRTKDEDAAVAAYSEVVGSQFTATRQAVSEMVGYFQGVNERAGRGGDVQAFEIKDAPRTFQTVLSEAEVPIETLQERMRIAGIDPSTSPDQIRVLGENVTELRDNIFRDTIRLHQGANPLTVVEERVEGETKRALSEGRITMDWLRSQVSDYESASGETLLTDSEQSVYEAVSTLGNAYVSGRLRDQNLPSGLRSFLRSMIEYFKDVFARAGRLRKAITEGKVGKDFEQFLAQSVGLDEQAEVSAVRDAELARTFSIDVNSPMPDQNMAAEESGQPSPGGRVAEESSYNFSQILGAPTTYESLLESIEDTELIVPEILIHGNKQNKLGIRKIIFARQKSGGSSYFKAYAYGKDGSELDIEPVEIRISDHPNQSQFHHTKELNYAVRKEDGEIESEWLQRLADEGNLYDMHNDVADQFGIGKYNVLEYGPYNRSKGLDENLLPVSPKNQKPDIAAGLSESVDSRLSAGGSKPNTQSQQSTPKVNPESREPEGGSTFSIKPADYTARLDAALAKLETDPELRRDRIQKGRTALSKIRNRVKKSETSREGIIRGLGELEAIIRILPSEARGKIGGYRKLSTYKTDRGRVKYLLNRIEKVEFTFEDWLKDFYTEKRDKLFDRSKPSKDQAGKKRVGKAGSDIHSLFDTLRAAVDWTPDKADGYVAGLEAEILKGELTAEEEAHKQLEISLVPMFADWQNADADRRSSAVENAQNIFDKGYAKYRISKLAERERRGERRSKLREDTGKIGSLAEREEKAAIDNGLRGDWKDNLLGLLNFEQATQWVFGQDSKEAQALVDMEREAAYEKSDSTQAKMDGLEGLFTKLAGGKRLDGEKLRYDLAQKSITVGDIKLSQLEGLSVLMLWRQADGRRHMIGKLDDNGKPAGDWNYGQDFVNSVEGQLTPDALSVLDYLTKEYAGEYATLNPLYRELNGIDLPKNANYSPITVTPLQAQGGQVIDPVTGTATAAGSSTPGSLRTRGSATAEPNFRDAVETYIAHTRQIEHWKAYAKFSNEARALLANRDVGNSIEAKSGKQAVVVLRNWIDFFSNGGTRDAATSLSLNGWLSKLANRASSIALIGRIGTLAVQSTQLGAALAQMPSGAYVTRFAKLFTGQLGWGKALDSAYIQRRMKEMPPVVQQAVQGLRQTKPNLLRHAVQKLGSLISGADALFTAGTYAMVYDYQLSQAKDSGLIGQEAEEFARNEAEKVTDRIAQPIRPGARSLFENTSTQPLARAAWAFASEARKNLALSAFAMAQRPMEEKLRTLAYVVIFNSALAAIIRNAWRDAKDNDDDEAFDEKNWNLKKFAVSTLTEPFYGIPVIGNVIQSTAYNAAGVYQQNGDLFSSFSNVVGPATRLPDLVTSNQSAEQSFKDVDAILSAAGLFNPDMAAAASLSHLANDLFRVGKNATHPDE